MAIIYSYPLNDHIKSLDELVGTTEQIINGQLKTVTRNFLLADLADFFIVDGGLQKTITLTTNGTGGPSTLNQTTGILNIPNYSPGITSITLSGAVSGTGSSSIATTLANNIVGIANLTATGSPSATTYLRGDNTWAMANAAITPAALTKTDDTNVTLTLGGTPNTALLQATSLTLGWTGTLADSRIASATNWNTAYTNRITSLTTTGTSGAATLVANVLNIPNYLGSQSLQQVLTIGNTATRPIYLDLTSNTSGDAAVTITMSSLEDGGPAIYINGPTDYNNASNIVQIQSGITPYNVFSINKQAFVTAPKFIKTGGTSVQFLMADGSVSTGGSGVTSVTATSPITSSGGATPIISTSMATNKLIGRSTAGTGVMEQITVGSGLTLSGGTLTNTATATPLGYYGAFQDMLTQTLVAVNTGQPFLIRTTDENNGVSITTNGSGQYTRITPANAGTYNIQWSGQFQNADNAIHDVNVWFRKGLTSSSGPGTDIVGSNGKIASPARKSAIAGEEGHTVSGWNFVLTLAAGEYVEFYWMSDSLQVTLQAYVAGSPPPSTASLIVTVTQQAGIMAGTGITGLGVSGSAQTGATQTLAVGTTGTDFGITSSSNTQTFNLPSASATARGLVTINGQTFAGAKTFSTAPVLSSLTASQILALDASGNIQSLAVATYPTLAELAYIKGVTSAIQTQFSGKQPLATNLTTIANYAGAPYGFIKWNSGTGIGIDTTSYATLASPTFTGTVVLPSTTSIGTVSATEIGYLDNVTSSIQDQFTAKQDKSLAANSIMANNTTSAANAVAQVYKDIAEATLVGVSTITWVGTAPTNPINLTYRWTQIGSLVNVRCNLVYTTQGSGNTQVTISLPTDMPTPATISGFTSALDVQCYGVGSFSTTKALVGTNSTGPTLRRNAANNGYEFVIPRATNAATTVWFSIQYFV